MTKHCHQVCVLSMIVWRSDSRLCWPCWHGKWWRNRIGKLGYHLVYHSYRPTREMIWKLFFTFDFHILPWQRHMGDRIIPCRCISIKTKILPSWPIYRQHRNRLLKLLDCAGQSKIMLISIHIIAIQNSCYDDELTKTVFYTRFLSPTDHKCVESSTYWQFFYYRPPGKFRWTSVNHFDKQREISLKCDAKNIHLSLSIYIYITLSIINMDLLYRQATLKIM